MNPAVFVHETSVCESDTVGSGTKIWHFCHVMAGARIGKNCVLGQNCFVAANVVVGDGVKLQNNVSLFSGVVLEDEVFCGPSVAFTNVSRPRAAIDRRAEFEQTLIRRGATLGANATLRAGIVVGEYALVGAGAVVTESVAAHAEVVGVPAAQRGWVSKAGEPLSFDQTGVARCGRLGDAYQLVTADGVVGVRPA